MTGKALTVAEYLEMTSHLLSNDSVEEIQKDTQWNQGMVDSMSPSDPVRVRFVRIVESNNRILELKRRYNEHGKEADV